MIEENNSNEPQNTAFLVAAVMCSAFYEVYHKADNHYVVWCKRELMAIDAYFIAESIDWHPYPYFTNTKFPFDDITDAVRRHYT